ncbi:MAG: transglutaminase-like domain-containing protein, partial [Methanobrevibacter sp.]|nr:transglutaminase-like domain-containing protein [Candidatus Methanoflexus mossambicus]
GSKFESNSAKYGGGVYSSSPLDISSSNFVSNKASSNGGGIYSLNPMIIKSSDFRTNTVTNMGGAIYITGSSLSSIVGSKFESNSAKYGGGVYSSSPLDISSSNFVSNKASSNGGGIYSRNNVNLTKSSISRNSANYGSGIYSLRTLRLSSCSVSNNNAKFIRIAMSAPTSVRSGSTLVIKAGLVFGDNVDGAFYTSNGNVFVNGKKLTISNYAPNRKITLTISGKSTSRTSDKVGISTFNVDTKVSKTVTTKATVSSIQGSKRFSTSKNIKLVVSKSTSKTSSKVKASASSKVSKSSVKKATSNVVLPSSKISKSSKSVKQVYVSKKRGWVSYSMSITHNNFPDKKIRIRTKNVKTTINYKFVSKVEKVRKKTNKNTIITTKTTKKGNKIIKTIRKDQISYTYKNVKNPFLSASIGCEVGSKTIKNIANKFKNYKNKYDKANAIYKYIRKYVAYDSKLPNTAVGAWKKKKTNCVGFAHLIVAISRASGIPAQYEHKCKAFGSGHSAHIWSLLYINGKWIKADGTIKIVDSKGRLLKKETANAKIGSVGAWSSYKTAKGGHEIMPINICDTWYPSCTNRFDKNGNHIDTKITACKVNCNGWK